MPQMHCGKNNVHYQMTVEQFSSHSDWPLGLVAHISTICRALNKLHLQQKEKVMN